jgi:hypothetical protein
MFSRYHSACWAAKVLILATFVQPALAGQDATLTFTDPTNKAPTDVHVHIDVQNPDGSWGTVMTGPITIPPGITAQQKRDLIKAALQGTYGAANVTNAGDTGVNVHLNVDAAIKPHFLPGATGEDPDKVVGAAARSATAHLAGFFQPFDYVGRPAIFTAGIVTDVGELSAQVSAQELNFQTDGPIICQALFQRLAPRAPQYGAQINYAGDRLEVYFDPAYTVTQGGVILGTTSPSPGASGEVYLPRHVTLGDMNCDGVVDFRDINAFVLAISDPVAYAARYPDCDIRNGDVNGDGAVDFRDINPFVGLLGR